jgi:hypothetical protein
MPITMPVQTNRVMPQNGRATGGARANAEAFGARSAQALGNLGQTLQHENEMVYKVFAAARQRQWEAKKLDLGMELSDELRAFDADYRKKKQGEAAIKAGQDFDGFQQELMEKYKKRFDGAEAFNEWNKEHAWRIRKAFMGSGIGYGIQQEHVFNDSTVAASARRAAKELADPGLTPQGRQLAQARFWDGAGKITPNLPPHQAEAYRGMLRKGVLEGYQNRLNNLIESGNIQAAQEMFPELDDKPWGEQRNIPAWMREELEAKEYHALRQWTGMKAKELGFSAGQLRQNHQDFLREAMERDDFKPLEMERSALLRAGYLEEAAKTQRDINTFSALMPYLKTEVRSSLPEMRDAALRFLGTMKTPENTNYINGVEKFVAREWYAGQIEAARQDPAGFVAPGIETDYAGLNTAQKTALSVQRQAELLAGTGIEPQVLNAAQKNAIASAWDSDDNRAKAQAVSGVMAEYGTFGLRALAEAKLPQSIVMTAPVFAALSTPEQNRWTAAASMKKEEIEPDEAARKKNLERARNTRLARTMRGIAESLNSDAQQQASSNLESTLANYVTLGGRPEDIEGFFHIQNDGNLRLAVPVGSYKPFTEPYLIRRRAAFLESLDLDAPAGNTIYGQVENGIFVYDAAADAYLLISPDAGGVIGSFGAVRQSEIPDKMASAYDLTQFETPSADWRQ